MNGAARTNAFDDLLSQVTALGEIQSTGLAGFLRQIAIADVLSELRDGARDAKQIQRRRAGRLRAGSATERPRARPACSGAIQTCQESFASSPACSKVIGTCCQCTSANCRYARSGTGMPARSSTARDSGPVSADRRNLVADVRHFDVVGNDVVIKELQDLVALRALGIDQQRLAAIEGVEVSLDASLGVEQEGIDAVAGGQVANIVRNHAVQPADAVAAGQGDFRARPSGRRRRTRQQGLEFGANVAEVSARAGGWLRSEMVAESIEKFRSHGVKPQIMILPRL